MGNLKSLNGVLVCKIILCDLWLQLSGLFCVPSAAVPRMFTVGHRQRNSYWTENKSTATSTRVSYLYWLVLIGVCLLNSFPLSFLSAFYLSPKIRMIKKLFSCTSNYMFSCFSSSFVSPIF